MQIRVFTVSLNSDASLQEELNRFLRSVRVVDLRKELATVGGDSCWTFCVTYLDEATTASKYGERTKVDYMEVLDPQTFARFTTMRKVRSRLAERDSVPPYVIFTDAVLAEMAQLTELTTQAMSSIPGIGKKRLEKYGQDFLNMLKVMENEASGTVN